MQATSYGRFLIPLTNFQNDNVRILHFGVFCLRGGRVCSTTLNLFHLASCNNSNRSVTGFASEERAQQMLSTFGFVHVNTFNVAFRFGKFDAEPANEHRVMIDFRADAM